MRLSDTGAARSDCPVGIIGHKGQMGSMLMRDISSAGYVVHGMDRNPDTAGAPLFAEADMETFLTESRYIICCVPVTALRTVLAELAPRLSKERHILMDITSVKALPMEWMEETYDGPVIGSHPLFGPAPNPMDKKVALVKGSHADEEHCAFAERLFNDLACDVFWTTGAEHDTGVAFAQSLNFTVSAAFFCSLARHEGVRPFLTPSFKRHLEAARKHLTQDTAMFLEFTSMNPSFSSALDTYREILAEAASDGLARVAAEAAGWYETEAEAPLPGSMALPPSIPVD